MLYINPEYKDIAEKISIGETSLFSVLKAAEKDFNIYIIDDKTVKDILPKRDRLAHKYSCGRSLMVCGSYGMAGAAVLSAKAAYRTGVGFVDVVLPDSIYPIVAAAVPEAVFTPLPSCNNISEDHVDIILNRAEKANALLIGCGISHNIETTEAIKGILKSVNIPTVIDADGINCLEGSIQILERTDWDKVITPHYGEMSKLIGISPAGIQKDFVNIAGRFAKEHNTVVVLKGAFTAIADPLGNIYVNMLKGNPGMAVAGSGDMLAGMICALIASGVETTKAAVAAVYFHACAGDKAAETLSERSILPSDMIECLPCLFKKFE